jgi:hypothetical protein
MLRKEMTLDVTHRQKLAAPTPAIDAISGKRYAYPFVNRFLY